jgi:23S rRNA pseudouridine1911/1915/1917 synthase
MKELPPGCAPDSIVLTYPVPRELAGQRLDRFIQSRIPRLSRTRAQAIVKSCAYRADGRPRRASERVRAGETVLLVRPRFDEPETPQTFGVVYEDEGVLALDKPAGLPMHPTATYHRNTLTFLMRERYGEDPPRIAHRIDRETSGLVVCGQDRSRARLLQMAFERRQVEKTYLAIVIGDNLPDSGTIDLPMAPVREGLHVLMEVRDDGSPSVTDYVVRGRREGRCLVQLSPRTGRQHQLRVHLSAIGHPIVGDQLYGPERENAFLEYIDRGMTESLLERLGHDRQALHAYQLRLPHPDTQDLLELTCPLAPDLEELWGKPVSLHVTDT